MRSKSWVGFCRFYQLLSFVKVLYCHQRERPLNVKKTQCSEILKVSFYNLKYGLPIISLQSSSTNLSNENKKTGVSRTIVCFGILILILSWRQQCFHCRYFLTSLWSNNWRSIFDVLERLCKYFFFWNCLACKKFSW